MDKFIAVKPAAVYASDGSGTIAGSWKIDTLVEGTIAFLKQDGSLVAAGAPLSSLSTPSVTLVRSMGAGKGPLTIEGIDIATLKVIKVAYDAPSKKKVALGQYSGSSVDSDVDLNLPQLIANGDNIEVYVTNNDLPIENNHRTRIYQLDVVDSDVITGVTSDNILVKLIAKINADDDKFATATAISANGTDVDGIVFEGVSNGLNFDVTVGEGILELATISSYKVKDGVWSAALTSLTVVNDGINTFAQLAETERRSSAMLGYNGLQYKGADLFNLPSQLVSGTAYDTYELSWTPPLNDDLIRTNGFKIHCLLAVPTNLATLIGILENSSTGLFAGKLTTVAAQY